ncbi:MAG: nicotinate (nicotinamide) nucleotide adenylyltransferase [Desulfobulbus sp.]|nr:nicotinate (nicotinamide) nucleotide adenylyltransferase [Desulfobulbus sp.]
MVSWKNKRLVGLFGGTFDPVHQGHLDLVRHVLDRCGLDLLLFIPANRPPHKRQPVASFTDRVAMLNAAIADRPDFTEQVLCSLVEHKLPIPSYTIHTVQALREEIEAERFSLVIGADSLLELGQWYRVDELLDLVDLIVVQRGTVDKALISPALTALPPAYEFHPGYRRWIGSNGRLADYLDGIELPVSSSSIREDLRNGRRPPLLPSAVFHYIQQHALYGWKPS